MGKRYRIKKHSYVERSREGQFKKFTNIGRSQVADRRGTAKTTIPSGYGHRGDSKTVVVSGHTRKGGTRVRKHRRKKPYRR